MAEPISIQQLKNASEDANSLGEAVNGDENSVVTTRLGETYPTLSNALNQIDSKLDSANTQIRQGITNLFERGGLPATPFATKALMTESALVNGKYAMVTDDNDTANNGLYIKSEGAWVKSIYDPVGIVRDDIEKLESLRINKDKLYPYFYVDRGREYSDEISIFEKNLLSVRVYNATPDCYYLLNYMVHMPSDPDNTDERNNGWQFVRIPKSEYANGMGGFALTTIREESGKFKLEPNTGVVKFEMPAAKYSNGEVFEVIFDTTGIDDDFIYDGYNQNNHAFQRVIDPTLYDYDSNGLLAVKDNVDRLLKLDGLRINKDSVYPFIFFDRGLEVTNTVSKFEKHLLAIRVHNADPDYYYRLSYMVHLPSDPDDTDERSNGWQFARILKSEPHTEEILSNIRHEGAKFKLIPNTGIVRFEMSPTWVSRGEVFEVVFDTDGYDTDVIYDGYNKNGHAYQRIIDPLFYDEAIVLDIPEPEPIPDSLEINRNKLYPFTKKQRGTYSKTSVLSALEKSVLSIRVNNALPNTYYRISYLQRTIDGAYFGWQIRSIQKDVYESSNDLGEVLGDIDHMRTPVSTGITYARISPRNSDVTIDITFDAAMLPNVTNVHVRNRDTEDGFDHIIDPSNYYLSNYTTANTLPEKPVTVTDYHGFLPIDEYGAADFNNILFAKDIDAIIAPASVTKIMTALVVLDSPLRLTDILTVTEADVINTLDIQVGDEISLLDALHVLLLPSSNAMSMTLGRYVGELMGGGVSDFIKLMNNKAKSLGMQNTKYVDTHGISSNKTTIRDTLILMHEATKSYVIKDVWGKSTYTADVTGVNPRPLVVNSTFSAMLSNDWCLGGKTGTSGWRFNLTCYVELKNGYKGIVAVMRSEAVADRDKDLKDITNYVRNAYFYPETRKLTPLI